MTPAGDNDSYRLARQARIQVLEIYRVLMMLYFGVCALYWDSRRNGLWQWERRRQWRWLN